MQRSWALVWSVTISGRTPRFTSSGTISAALPHSAIEMARPSAVYFFDARQGVIQRGRLLIHVAGTQTEIDAALLTFDVQRAGAGQRRGQRLRAAHAAQTGG
ncbi:Uncharacterised protein [Klebsiella pneumoniae]|uniref:Uncharacterized protein n=1 Tax=Klebsiella pneumoniae TaxID=573 RepID=A0A2X3EPZ9_KLEPN|nr:Uncharacterised protein [Klebsiella pneumoniae]